MVSFNPPVVVPLGKKPSVPTEWALVLVRMFWRRRKLVAHSRNQNPDCADHKLVTTLTELAQVYAAN